MFNQDKQENKLVYLIVIFRFRRWIFRTKSSYSSPKSVDSSKYKNAKAISSADLFGDEPIGSPNSPQSKLNQFKGSQAVGSADLFGGEHANQSQQGSIDVDAIKYDNFIA